MYGWLWRHLPGGRWAKIAILTALVPAVLIVLFQWVFPWAEPLLPFGQTTVGN
jgi:hypothetical protein